MIQHSNQFRVRSIALTVPYRRNVTVRRIIACRSRFPCNCERSRAPGPGHTVARANGRHAAYRSTDECRSEETTFIGITVQSQVACSVRASCQLG